ncbi:hypothetical protein CAPTEDRAFT_131152 [Capitella teleta]|uniref:C2H2-type domain-containing protein n=1 Tax=Capitella teleta TaxID=283909 RepID=R7VLZ4_CAPTE|nr:hypothetical protein CAPTEDRAFT_131152 [Capitella teleta]|eukprot:ELU18671.1 hypothetical protein CAPTEDRAFT_131152 [Capitella teleta]
MSVYKYTRTLILVVSNYPICFQIRGSGDRRASCPWPGCQKQFSFQSHLKRHYTVHTRHKEFACPLCTHAYTRKSTLSNHIREKHTSIMPPAQTDV